jgi:VCBS repeat-containing protein
VQAATAVNDVASTNEDTSVTIGVLGNDTGSGLNVTSVGAPAHGTATIVSDVAGTIVYTPSPNWSGTDSFTYTMSEGSTLFYAGTGHYYEFVKFGVSDNKSWSSARDAAAGRRFYGMQGYLVTITSAGEQTFVEGKLAGQGWIGASDQAQEGTWRWVTGPEGFESGGSGRQFCTQTGGAVEYGGSTMGGSIPFGGQYSNWANGEPNNANYEDHGHFLEGGKWNDYKFDNAAIAGYVVEYGGTVGDTPIVPTSTVTVNVSPVNDSPMAAPDAFTTAEDTALVVAAPGVLANDTDIDGPGLQAVRVSGPSHGTLILDASGSLRYSPAVNYYGSDLFWYKVSDGTSFSTAAVVNLTITPVNDAPTGITLTGGFVPENAPVGTEVGSLTTQDPETTIGFSYSLSGEGAGVVELFNVNHLRTKAGLDFEARSTYTLHVRTTDSGGLSYERDFVIAVTNVNEAPVAANDSYAPIEDAAMAVSAPGVLANDSDVDGDHPTVRLLTGPAHGTLALQADGSFTYVPDADYCGSDTFTYEAWDGALAGAPATVTLTMVSANDAPSFTKGADQTVLEDCGPQTVSGWATSMSAGPANEAGQTLDFVVTNDNKDLFAVQPAIATDGTLIFTPAPNQNGSATVTVMLHDNGGMANGGVDTSAPQTFTIGVSPVNDAPANTAQPGIAGTINVDDTLTASTGIWNDTIDTSVSGTSTLMYAYQWVRADDASGTNVVDIASATSPTYVLSAPDSHMYLRVRVTCTDGGVGLPATQSVTLLTPWISQVINRLPVITEGTSTSVTMDEDGSPLAWSVTLNARDADGDTIAWSILTQALHGTATASGTGTSMAVSYTPLANWNGSDSFVVQVSDGYGGTASITVNVTVNPRNDAPVNTIPPSISGIPHVGWSLTTTTGVWNDALDTDVSGTSILSYAYQWQRSTDGGTVFTDITGASGSSYALTLQDNLQQVHLQVICGDTGVGQPIPQSTTVFSLPMTILNAAPVIAEGSAVSTSCDEDESPASFTLVLHAADPDAIDTLTWHIVTPPAHGNLTLPMPAVGSSTTPSVYHPVPNWNGTDSLTLRVEDGLTGTDEITVTVTVNPRNDAPLNIVKPSIDGNLFVNHEARAVIGCWNDSIDLAPGRLTYTYQWLRARDAAGTGLALIPGATASTYIVSPIDEGMYLAVRVTCTDDGEGLPVSMSASADSAFLPARYLDMMPPTIELPDFSSWPGVTGISGGTAPSFTVNRLPFDLYFMVEDDRSGVQWKVSVNGVEARSSVGTGTIDRSVSLTEGTNRVDITAVDEAGNRAERHLTITLDTHAPVVVLPRPVTRMVTGTTLNVEGTISDELSGVRTLNIDGTEVVPYLDGTFKVTLPLKRGLNTIAGETLDNAGNRASFTWVVDLTPVQQQRVGRTIDLTIDRAVMVVDGVSVTMDVAPVIRQNRSFLPLRALVEEIGGSIAWNAKTRQVTVKARGVTMLLTIGKNSATVNGKTILIDPANSKVVPVILGSRMFLPLRFIAEQLGLDIAWYAPTRTVTIAWEP